MALISFFILFGSFLPTALGFECGIPFNLTYGVDQEVSIYASDHQNDATEHCNCVSKVPISELQGEVITSVRNQMTALEPSYQFIPLVTICATGGWCCLLEDQTKKTCTAGPKLVVCVIAKSTTARPTTAGLQSTTAVGTTHSLASSPLSDTYGQPTSRALTETTSVPPTTVTVPGVSETTVPSITEELESTAPKSTEGVSLTTNPQFTASLSESTTQTGITSAEPTNKQLLTTIGLNVKEAELNVNALEARIKDLVLNCKDPVACSRLGIEAMELLSANAAKIVIGNGENVNFSPVAGIGIKAFRVSATKRNIDIEEDTDLPPPFKIEFGEDKVGKVAVVGNISNPSILHLDKTPIEKSNENQTLHKNVTVLSVSFYDQSAEKLSMPVNFTLSLANDFTETTYDDTVTQLRRRCVYFDVVNTKWSSFGCFETFFNETTVQCSCNHTTTFASILQIKIMNTPAALTAVASALQVISILCLVVTVLLLGLWRKNLRNKDRIGIQISLVLSLLAFHLAVIVSKSFLYNTVLCHSVTFIAHSSLILSAAFMLLEGVIVHIKTSQTFDKEKRHNLTMLLLSWAIPVIFCGLVCLWGSVNHTYMDLNLLYHSAAKKTSRPEILEGLKQFDNCWLGMKHGFIYTAIIPVGISLIVNVYIAVRVGVIVWTLSRRTRAFQPSQLQNCNNNLKHVRKSLRAIVILCPIFGLPWILALMVNIEEVEMVFKSLHVIVNATQGVWLFLLYIVADRDLRDTLRRRYMNKIHSGTFTRQSFTKSRNSTFV